MSARGVPDALAIVIPARDAAGTIAEQLQALVGEMSSSVRIVVVADNGSIDATREIAEGFADRLPIRIVDAREVPGSASARNVGVEAVIRADADIDALLFCDADDTVASGWIRGLTTGLSEDDLVGGRLDGELLNSATVATWRSERTVDALSIPEDFLPFAGSGNFAIWRSVWEELGGMDVTYPKSHDVEFCWRAQLAGYTIGYAPDAVVHYRYRASTGDAFRQAVKSGRAMAQLYGQFGVDGLRGRAWSTTAHDWAWLVARLPMVAQPSSRGVWARRLGQAVGRARGSVAFRVRYL
jgi:GT2 family glycosyltransferase